MHGAETGKACLWFIQRQNVDMQCMKQSGFSLGLQELAQIDSLLSGLCIH